MDDTAELSSNLRAIPHIQTVSSACRKCPGCGSSSSGELFLAPGDPASPRAMFAYFCCRQCGSLSLAQELGNLADYYDSSYYSQIVKRSSLLRSEALRVRNALSAFAPDAVYRAVAAISNHPALPSLRPILSGRVGGRFGRGNRWLDIGCGAGNLLRDMRNIGFSDLTGVDPFIITEETAPGLRLFRTDAMGVSEVFDVVMMHHALEHVVDTEAVLSTLHRLVRDDGVALIRIPLADSYAWRTYGGEWGNFDAPRHVTLFSQSGFQCAAERTGWKVALVNFDSIARSIYASEARLLGTSEHREDVRNRFPTQRLRQWSELARRLNRNGEADQAAFYLTH